MNYAQTTTVSVAKSKADLEKLLRKFGVVEFGVVTDGKQAQIAFKLSGLPVRFGLPLPDPGADRFCKTKRLKERSEEAALKSWEQECRSVWRGLLLIVKAMLIAVESGTIDLKTMFMPFIVTGNGKTVGERTLPKLDMILSTGDMPLLLEMKA